jgi:hypothetical protein
VKSFDLLGNIPFRYLACRRIDVVLTLNDLSRSERANMKKVVVHKPGTVKLTGAATPKHAA